MTKEPNTKIPEDWLGEGSKEISLIEGKFLAFKTPLSRIYNLEALDEFLPQHIFEKARRDKVKIGLWIDLTNTYRYYSQDEIEQEGCKYVKLKCPGRGEYPPANLIKYFIDIVHDFCAERPQEFIAVHCTHGFNRTGFFIVTFLVEKLNYDVKKAVKAFSDSRKPGIYRGNYIAELFRRYGNISEAPDPPSKPMWSR